MPDIDRLVAGIAPDPGPGMTPGARELLDEITAMPVPAAGGLRRWLTVPHGRRWQGLSRPARRFAAPLVAGIAAAATMLSWALPGLFGTAPASAALDIRQEGDNMLIMVRDMYAAPAAYQRELRDRGLRISLVLDPAPPSLAGRMVVMDRRSSGLSNVELRRRKDLISTIDRPGGCDQPWQDCPIGIRVPVRYRGQAEISLARPARPGEIYRWRTSLAAPGGLLHCVPFVNRPLSEVRPLLESRGVTIRTISYGDRQAGKPVPGRWYVHDAVLESATSALVLVWPTKKDLALPEAVGAPENMCRKGSPKGGSSDPEPGAS
ncbi:hypothetical protein [Streptosporangium sandarakinum]